MGRPKDVMGPRPNWTLGQPRTRPTSADHGLLFTKIYGPEYIVSQVVRDGTEQGRYAVLQLFGQGQYGKMAVPRSPDHIGFTFN